MFAPSKHRFYLVQGVTDLAELAQRYLLKDELGASPAQMSYIMSVAGFPWTVKPLFGLISDTLPLWGYRRKSYLVAAGMSGALGWLLLSLAARSLGSAVGLMALTNAASSLSDVVVDSMVVERARREAAEDAGSLQSLCWAAYSVGQIGSAYWSGALVQRLGPRGVFALTALLPLLVVVMGVTVREARKPGVMQLLRRLWAGEGGGGGGAAADAGASDDRTSGHRGRRCLRRSSAAGGGDGGEGEMLMPLRPLICGDKHGSSTGGVLGCGGGGITAKDGVPMVINGPASDLVMEQELQWVLPGAATAAGRRELSAAEEAEAGAAEERVPLTLPFTKAECSGGGGRDSRDSEDSDSDDSISFSYAGAGGSRPQRSGGGGGRTASLGAALQSLWGGLCATVGQLWGTLRQREVAAPLLFLFCSAATPAADDAMFFFMTGPLGFSATFLGDVQLGVAVASLAGVGIYHAFLRRRSLRVVLLFGTILAALCQASSLVLATGANRAVGLDDHLFALGDSVMVSVIQNVLFMPTMVLATRLCPPGMEATLFAALMSVVNIADRLRYLLGALLTQALGVTSTDFRRLPALIAICSVSLLLPLPLLLLVPKRLDSDSKSGPESNSLDADPSLESEADARDGAAAARAAGPKVDAVVAGAFGFGAAAAAEAPAVGGGSSGGRAVPGVRALGLVALDAPAGYGSGSTACNPAGTTCFGDV